MTCFANRMSSVRRQRYASLIMGCCKNISCVKQDFEKGISAHVKWENYLVSLGNRPLQQSAELKNMIRTGVPMEYRSRVWKA
jgi:hypothetical protein